MKLLDTPIQYLKGVGPKKAKLFAQLGIITLEDLLYYFPYRYEDRRQFSPISKLKPGESQTLKATVLAKGERKSWKRRGFSITEVAFQDETGKIFAVWFNQPYLKNYFKVGQSVILYGRIEQYKDRLQINSPEFEIIQEPEEDNLSIGRIVPIYSLTTGMTQRYFRKMTRFCLDEFIPQISDILPYDLRARHNLFNLAQSLINIHFPENDGLRQEAYRRLSFEEFFLYQIPLILRKLSLKQKQGISHYLDQAFIENLIKNLPFNLTAAQIKVLAEIKKDMSSPKPMQRLLEGDVGSGKTVVAFLAAMIALRNNYQVALMVPTEILAKQHYERIGQQNKKIKLALLTSSTNKKEKEKIYKEMRNGKINFLIGTHALLEEDLKFKNLSLVIIDEQHKFGVGQRALLPKKGISPDVLIMTATPIPRTLALTIYGDLDVSVIDELPPGRQPVKTILYNDEQREEVYQFLRREIQAGRQIYIVYPIIEESFVLDLKAAKVMYETLRKKTFKEFRVDLIHGQMKQTEQDTVMQKFKNGEIDILVATSVLEVGIDVANASCMVIEHAQRFGLSQLHQLRGRIGRGAYESFCILIAQPQTQEAIARIKAITTSNNGFKIAEEDLRIRGPGEFFGRRQHGLTELKIANPITQMHLLKMAREEAIKLINADPKLETRQNLLLKEKLSQRFPEYEKLMVVG